METLKRWWSLLVIFFAIGFVIFVIRQLPALFHDLQHLGIIKIAAAIYIISYFKKEYKDATY